MRIGIGYDIHKLVSGRDLVLGGVLIPYKKGLLGHSDADVLTHSLCDALLGAAGMHDIGYHFPDTDLQYKNMNSIILLGRVYAMLNDEGFSIVNTDSTIFAESPRLLTYNESMKQNVAQAIKIDPAYVNIKATTTEGIGVIGKGEGIGAMTVALIRKQVN